MCYVLLPSFDAVRYTIIYFKAYGDSDNGLAKTSNCSEIKTNCCIVYTGELINNIRFSLFEILTFDATKY